MCSRIRSAFSVTWVSWRWRRLLSARSRKLSMVALPDLQIGGVVVARVAYCLRGTDGPVFVAGHGHLLDLGEGNLGLVLERLGVLVLRQAPLVVRRPESPVLTPDDEAMDAYPAPGSHLLVKLDRQAQFRVGLVIDEITRLLAGQFEYGHGVSSPVALNVRTATNPGAAKFSSSGSAVLDPFQYALGAKMCSRWYSSMSSMPCIPSSTVLPVTAWRKVNTQRPSVSRSPSRSSTSVMPSVCIWVSQSRACARAVAAVLVHPLPGAPMCEPGLMIMVMMDFLSLRGSGRRCRGSGCSSGRCEARLCGNVELTSADHVHDVLQRPAFHKHALDCRLLAGAEGAGHALHDPYEIAVGRLGVIEAPKGCHRDAPLRRRLESLRQGGHVVQRAAGEVGVGVGGDPVRLAGLVAAEAFVDVQGLLVGEVCRNVAVGVNRSPSNVIEDRLSVRFIAEHGVRGTPWGLLLICLRSEERRVGKECRSRWSPYHSKSKQ